MYETIVFQFRHLHFARLLILVSSNRELVRGAPPALFIHTSEWVDSIARNLTVKLTWTPEIGPTAL